MMKTRVVHAGPADDVCRIIWMAWNKKGNRQETPDHLEFIDPECSPAPLHSNNLFSSLLLHNWLHTVAQPLLCNTAQLRKYRVSFKLCLPQKWLQIWFRAGHTWYLVHHRTISAIKKYDRKCVRLLQNTGQDFAPSMLKSIPAWEKYTTAGCD